jgi:hypothetical protein
MHTHKQTIIYMCVKPTNQTQPYINKEYMGKAWYKFSM